MSDYELAVTAVLLFLAFLCVGWMMFGRKGGK